MISANLVGCATARNKGTCDNRVNIRREALEGRIVKALREQLMDLALFKMFCEEFTRELNRLGAQARSGAEDAKVEIKKIDRDLDALLDLIQTRLLAPPRRRPFCTPRWLHTTVGKRNST